MSVLPVSDDDLVSCVRCGLCLPHCPTFRVTGLELASPRGRIVAMRAVQSGAAPLDAEFARAMEECVQCRACEAACPSGVRFGRMMQGARAAVENHRPASRTRWRRLGEWLAFALVVPRHGVLVTLTWLLLVAQRLRLVPRRAALPPLSARSLAFPLRGDALSGVNDAYLMPGCVMDAWQRDVHRAALRVMRACGARTALPARGAGCCGALHAHAGRLDEARRLARRVVASMPGDAPVVVDSAGCGAAMREYGELLGTPDAERFAARVRDVSEWVAEQGVPPVRRTGRTVVVQDPCHLRHVQRREGEVRAVLGDAYVLLETDDDGSCCGAGGAYRVVQPALAEAIRGRKVAALQAAGTRPGVVVASANPGCAFHLTAAGLQVRHPIELLADALLEPEEER